MKTTEWNKKWPTEPGRYWFYGWRYGRTKDLSNVPIAPELCSVKVVALRNGVCYVCEGQFWYQSEGGIGLFHSADVPVLPNVSKLVKL
jgi:hypothetical protein